jgi:hypothetical protein
MLDIYNILSEKEYFVTSCKAGNYHDLSDTELSYLDLRPPSPTPNGFLITVKSGYCRLKKIHDKNLSRKDYQKDVTSAVSLLATWADFMRENL